MKKSILLAMTLSCSVVSAQSFQTGITSSGPNTSVTIPYTKAPTSITQNNNTSTIDSSNSIRCPSGENKWLRVFDLDGDHGVTGFFDVTSVDLGVQSSDAKNIEVRLYQIPNGAATPPSYSDMTQLTSVTLPLTANSTPTALNAAITGTVNGSTHDLVVELFEDTTVSGTFFPGANSLGQTKPGYITAAGCSVSSPTDITTLGASFANTHLLMVVNGSSGYPIRGSITGVTGATVLQLNGANDITVSADGSFEFSTLLDTGDNYSVTVTPPTGQVCNVTNGTGTVASSAVTNVQVACRAAVVPPVPSTGSFGVMLMILGMLGLGWFTARRFQ